MRGTTRPTYTQLKYWADNYGGSGATDQRAVETFIECENRETVASLRNDLSAVAKGNYEQATLEKMLKPQRLHKHSSYAEWAKLMLLWMAAYKG
jgi:hypothetical protein